MIHKMAINAQGTLTAVTHLKKCDKRAGYRLFVALGVCVCVCVGCLCVCVCVCVLVRWCVSVIFHPKCIKLSFSMQVGGLIRGWSSVCPCDWVEN